MGVKQSVDPELDRVLGVINSSAPKYSLWTKLSLMLALIKRGDHLKHFTCTL